MNNFYDFSENPNYCGDPELYHRRVLRRQLRRQKQKDLFVRRFFTFAVVLYITATTIALLCG